jgi:hypothetical protein
MNKPKFKPGDQVRVKSRKCLICGKAMVPVLRPTRHPKQQRLAWECPACGAEQDDLAFLEQPKEENRE